MNFHQTYGIITKVYLVGLVVIGTTLYAFDFYPKINITQSAPFKIDKDMYVYRCLNVTVAGMPYESHCDTLRIERPDTLGMKRLYR